MKTTLSLALALAISAMATPTWAAQDDPHQGHHPASTASAPTPKSTPNRTNPKMACMGMQMQAMHEMHDKMMAAKTPEERNALMAEHMKVMKNGMDMMKDMSVRRGMKGERAAHDPMMEMMQGMMQMMMDRLPATDGTTEKQP